MAPVLETHQLHKVFGGVVAVDRLDLAIPAGSISAIIGPNGAGKTTLLNMLSGAYRPTSGRIQLLGQDVTGMPPAEIARLGLSRTFQNIRLFNDLTALENLMVAQQATAAPTLIDAILRTGRFRRAEERMRVRAAEALAEMGLSQVTSVLARHLAHGQKRLLELARASVTGARVILLDEPAAGMNSRETEELKGRVAALRARGATVVLVEHNMRFVMSLSDQVTVLDFGRKIAAGTPAQVSSDPEVIRAYLGKRLAAG